MANGVGGGGDVPICGMRSSFRLNDYTSKVLFTDSRLEPCCKRDIKSTTGKYWAYLFKPWIALSTG